MHPNPGNAPVRLQPYRGDRVSQSLKITGIMHIVAGSFIAVLGIVAAGITGVFSYIAVPIWSGLFSFLVAGILGLLAYQKTNKPGLLISYIVMCIISACLAFILFVMYIVAATSEDVYNSWSWDCHPTGVDSYEECRGPAWSRILIEVLIVLSAAFEGTVSIVAASFAGYKMCVCCRTCCGDTSQPQRAPIYMMVYSGNEGSVPVVSIQPNQATGPVYFAGQQPSSNQPLLLSQCPGQITSTGPVSFPSQGAHPTIQSQQYMVVQPTSQIQGQQFIVAQPTGQIQGQPTGFQGNQFMSAQPTGPFIVQNTPQGSAQATGQNPTVMPYSGNANPVDNLQDSKQVGDDTAGHAQGIGGGGEPTNCTSTGPFSDQSALV